MHLIPRNLALRLFAAALATLALAPCATTRPAPVPQAVPNPRPKSPSSTSTTASSSASSSTAVSSREQQVEDWSRALAEKPPSTSAYNNLSAFAMRRNSGDLGRSAALALGHYNYEKGSYALAHTWLDRASGDALLGDYVLYWSAETDLALNKPLRALEELKSLRTDYPDSVITDLALEALAKAAIEANEPQVALDALGEYSAIDTKPNLLFARAQAREQSGNLVGAYTDYVSVYYRYPMSEPSHEAGSKADLLASKLPEAPKPPLALRVSRATALFASHEWYEAREDYLRLLPDLTGSERERAELRIAQCRVRLGASISALTEPSFNDSDVDAERLYYISQEYREKQSQEPMLAAIDAAIARAPESDSAEKALFAAGNYFWVQLDRDRAVSYYSRIDQSFPTANDVMVGNWRVAWTAYLEKKPQSAELFKAYLQRFPSSPYVKDDLYWLARQAETSGDEPLARAYYSKLRERFPQSYFGELAATRLRQLGPGPTTVVAELNTIPTPPSPLPISPSVPSTALIRVQRAAALRTIAFDASAELELRAAYATTGEPRLLLEAAQAAIRSGHYAAGMSAARQLYPGLEARRFEDVPKEIWLTAFPLPYETQLRAAATRAGVDPMIVAGLIRQESTFDTNAVSHAGAYGLMQLMPKTARLLARQQRVGYSRARLTDPSYNLRLGTIYLAQLQKNWGDFEAALAAYNAGEDHVATWKSGQTYTESAEFVDSIPFTETRDYVQIVLRNAEIYRRLYGTGDENSQNRD
jgi:soluble lytic murein transglycosylase